MIQTLSPNQHRKNSESTEETNPQRPIKNILKRNQLKLNFSHLVDFFLENILLLDCQRTEWKWKLWRKKRNWRKKLGKKVEKSSEQLSIAYGKKRDKQVREKVRLTGNNRELFILTVKYCKTSLSSIFLIFCYIWFPDILWKSWKY